MRNDTSSASRHGRILGNGILLWGATVMMMGTFSAVFASYAAGDIGFGPAIAVGLIAATFSALLALFGVLGVWLWHHWLQPNLTYEVLFHPHVAGGCEWPPTSDHDIQWQQKMTRPIPGPPDGAFIYLRLRATMGGTVRDVHVQFVTRHWKLHPSLWQWDAATPIVEQLEDPVTEGNQRGGQTLTYSKPKELSKGDCLYLRLVVAARNQWSGHLEVSTQAAYGQKGFIRRSVTLV